MKKIPYEVITINGEKYAVLRIAGYDKLIREYTSIIKRCKERAISITYILAFYNLETGCFPHWTLKKSGVVVILESWLTKMEQAMDTMAGKIAVSHIEFGWHNAPTDDKEGSDHE